MKQRPRIYYTESQKKLMWDHWQKGDSLQHIAQLFTGLHSPRIQIPLPDYDRWLAVRYDLCEVPTYQVIRDRAMAAWW